MGSEADEKRKIVEAMRKAGGYARRIEDSFSVGFPDLIVGHPDLPHLFVIEAKIVRGKFYEPTPRQYIELTRLKPWTFPIVLGITSERFFFSKPVPARRIHTGGCWSSADPFPQALKEYALWATTAQ